MSQATPFTILHRAAKGFVADNALSLSAALSFYTLLSFAPLIVLAIWAGSTMGPNAQLALFGQIEQLLGDSARDVAQIIVENAEERPALGSTAGLTGIAMSVLGATTVFAQLQNSLNRIWHIKAHPGAAVAHWLRRRVLSMGVIAAITFVLMVSLIISTLLGLVFTRTGHYWDVLNELLTLPVFAGLFALLFRYLPDARLDWKRALRGGFTTAVMFTIGKWAIGFYLSHGSVGGAYGAAGSLAILLVWIYYSSAIFFFGAEIIQASVESSGEEIPLARHAVRLEFQSEP